MSKENSPCDVASASFSLEGFLQVVPGKGQWGTGGGGGGACL